MTNERRRFPWLNPPSLLHAWEHVRENHGCAGADGVTIERFAERASEEIDELRAHAETGDYRPLPLLPITIPKKPGSAATRTLLVPTVRDRVLQTAIGRHLGQTFEDDFLDCSFAYRPHRSVHSAIARIRYLHDHGFRYIASADIDSYLDASSYCPPICYGRSNSVGTASGSLILRPFLRP